MVVGCRRRKICVGGKFVLSRSSAYIAAGAIIVRRNPRGPPSLAPSLPPSTIKVRAGRPRPNRPRLPHLRRRVGRLLRAPTCKLSSLKEKESKCPGLLLTGCPPAPCRLQPKPPFLSSPPFPIAPTLYSGNTAKGIGEALCDQNNIERSRQPPKALVVALGADGGGGGGGGGLLSRGRNWENEVAHSHLRWAAHQPVPYTILGVGQIDFNSSWLFWLDGMVTLKIIGEVLQDLTRQSS